MCKERKKVTLTGWGGQILQPLNREDMYHHYPRPLFLKLFFREQSHSERTWVGLRRVRMLRIL